MKEIKPVESLASKILKSLPQWDIKDFAEFSGIPVSSLYKWIYRQRFSWKREREILKKLEKFYN